MPFKKYLILFCFFAVPVFFLNFTGCVSGKKIIPDAENLSFASFNKEPAKGIMVISDRREGQFWFRTQENWRIESLANPPATFLYDVWQIEISPDDRFLAVLSAGEGHPALDIFEMKEILREDESDDDLNDPVLSINPYPGSIWVKGWENENSLAVESDMPLDSYYKKDIDFQLLEPEEESSVFLIDVDALKITVKGK